MGNLYGGGIVTSGLVIALDASSPRSYGGSGTTLYDLSGNSVNGTLQGATVASGSSSGSVVTFVSASNQYVGFTGSADFDFGTGDFCIEAWFNTSNSTTRQHLFGLGASSTPNLQFDMNDSGYGIWCYYNGGGSDYVRVTTNYGDGRWHQTMVQRSGTTITLYVDNVSITTDVYAGSFLFSGAPCTLGLSYTGGSLYYNGSIGAFRIYNKSLSSGERTQNYNATKGRFD